MGEMMRTEEQYRAVVQNSEDHWNARKEFWMTGTQVANCLGCGYRTEAEQLEQTRFAIARQRQILSGVPHDALPDDPSEERRRDDRGAQEAMEWGQLHEPDGLHSFRLGYKQWVYPTGIHVVDRRNLISTSPDGLLLLDAPVASQGMHASRVVAEFGASPVGVWECKCPYFRKQIWRGAPPLPHQVQVHAEMAGTGAKEGYLHCWTPSGSGIWRLTFSDSFFACEVLQPCAELISMALEGRPWTGGKRRPLGRLERGLASLCQEDAFLRPLPSNTSRLYASTFPSSGPIWNANSPTSSGSTSGSDSTCATKEEGMPYL